MSTQQMDELLQIALAPWDERSWGNLSESHPATAEALARGVQGGLTVAGIRDYCTRWGYPDWVSNWLAQCVQHLHRQMAGDTAAGRHPIADVPAAHGGLRPLAEPEGVPVGLRRIVEQGEGE